MYNVVAIRSGICVHLDVRGDKGDIVVSHVILIQLKVNPPPARCLRLNVVFIKETEVYQNWI